MRKERTILVVHPEKGEFRAERVRDKLEAAQRAARAWGLQWSWVARACSFHEKGEEI